MSKGRQGTASITSPRKRTKCVHQAGPSFVDRVQARKHAGSIGIHFAGERPVSSGLRSDRADSANRSGEPMTLRAVIAAVLIAAAGQMLMEAQGRGLAPGGQDQAPP